MGNKIYSVGGGYFKLYVYQCFTAYVFSLRWQDEIKKNMKGLFLIVSSHINVKKVI